MNGKCSGLDLVTAQLLAGGVCVRVLMYSEPLRNKQSRTLKTQAAERKTGRWPQKKFFRLMATDKFCTEELEHDLPSVVKWKQDKDS